MHTDASLKHHAVDYVQQDANTRRLMILLPGPTLARTYASWASDEHGWHTPCGVGFAATTALSGQAEVRSPWSGGVGAPWALL